MKKLLHFILLIILGMLIISFYKASESESENNSTIIPYDSLFGKSHEVTPELFFDLKNDNMNPPILSGKKTNVNSPYQNINISHDSFPQNEPSVKISRKNPNRVVVAWRDFRTGVNPALRRIGHSYSSDGGITWSEPALLQPYSPSWPYASDPAVCVDTAGNFYISTISLNLAKTNLTVVVYKSTNEGVSFDGGVCAAPHADTGQVYDDKEYINCDLVEGSPYKNTLYVAWASTSGDVLVKSTNGGINWSDRVNIVPNGGGTGLFPVIGLEGEVYIVWLGYITNQGYGVYLSKSVNGGSSFSSQKISSTINGGSQGFPSAAVDLSGGPRNGYIYVVWADITIPNTSYDDVLLAYSSDRGNTWSDSIRVNNDSINSHNRQYWPWITVNSNGTIHIIFYDSRNTEEFMFEAYLARSVDGGKTFENILLSSTPSPRYSTNPEIRFGDYINIDSWQGKIIPVWTDERAGGENMEIYTALIRDTLIGISPAAGNIPIDFKLLQNYPNPFNPTTKITYNIPRNAKIKLIVYDILGREIVRLINDELKLAGSYTIEFNGTNLPSGVYFYRLESGNYSESKKMVLIK